MSDNKNNHDNLNDPNDDEKKEDFAGVTGPQNDGKNYVEFTSSDKFHEYSRKILGYMDQIYSQNPKNFCDKDFKLYVRFLELFQPGKSVVKDKELGGIICQSVQKILSKYARQTNAEIQRKNYEQSFVQGLLYATFQGQFNGDRFYDEKSFIELSQKKGFSAKLLSKANIYFAVSSRRPYNERTNIKVAGRIAIHLSISPKEFWRSDMSLQLINAFRKSPSISAIKFRHADYFNVGDSILLYTTKAPEDVWRDVQHVVTTIIPADCRSNYEIPFSEPFDLGINGNIPIECFDPYDLKTVKSTSFTEGLGILARRAYLQILKDNTSDADRRASHFAGYLGALFEHNKLKMTKSGALAQPVPPKPK